MTKPGIVEINRAAPFGYQIDPAQIVAWHHDQFDRSYYQCDGDGHSGNRQVVVDLWRTRSASAQL
jgi:hypothetical protein